MNLYIINDVLYDYTAGMVVIAAQSLQRCEQIFMESYGGGGDYSKKIAQEEYNQAEMKVIENVPYEKEEVVSYVYGGG